MAKENKYKIDGNDVWTTWGIWFERGIYSELLKFPKRKEQYTQEWPDESGTVRDDSNNVYESVELNLNAYMIGNSESDFITKLAAFRTYITTAGYFNFDAIDLNIRFKLIYQNMSGYTLLNRLNNGGKVMAKFTLNLIDDEPTNHPAP